ncbi:hypothetical protein WSM22_25470 [Cytophagales bacterium WSM2-2]|nr:hypothetical protein WSM22_25470 [Cytophagales bacterium WSM2-2]
MIISKTGAKSWTNRHETFTQNINDLYNLANQDSGDVVDDYNDATKGIQSIIKDAIASGKTLRILGGEWSWTKIAATDGILLNTKPLNLSLAIGRDDVSSGYAKTPDDLYFAQCGVSVKELNDRLKKRKRSLKTTGASNGQTIVGGMSTGTHGAAIDVGSIPDYVVGLHIITSPTRHIWLERKSYPVASDSFAEILNAELVRDDDMFNAALVSFGSFGFIHGVMLETDPLFLYQAFRLRVPMDNNLFSLMETLDFTNTAVSLPNGHERPYHFQALINQYDTSNQAYMTVMYKRPYKTPYTPPAMTTGIAPGDDAPVFIGKITQALPAIVPGAVNALVGASYKPYSDVWGTHGEMFTNTDTHGKVLSSALGVPINYVNQVRQLFVAVNKSKGPFVGVLAFRYVRGTQATLGFTRFPNTCVIELDSVFSNESMNFYTNFWNEMIKQGIPFTFHWGKLLDLNKTTLRTMYTDAKVESWLSARYAVMKDVASMHVFTNDFMRQISLDVLPSVPV